MSPQARESLRDDDRIESWNFPDRFETAEQLATALDTWKSWAQGQPITRQQIIATIDNLHEHAQSSRSPGAHALSDVITRCVKHHGIDGNHLLQTRASVEIEIDKPDVSSTVG